MQKTLHNQSTRLPLDEPNRLLMGIFVGLLAASIGALYTVYARWGFVRGLSSPDLTALRFGVAGIATFPFLLNAVIKHRETLVDQWRVWLAVSLLAGTPFGLLMFGALQPKSRS